MKAIQKQPTNAEGMAMFRKGMADMQAVIDQLPELAKAAHTAHGRAAVDTSIAVLEPWADAIEGAHRALQGAMTTLRAMRGQVAA